MTLKSIGFFRITEKQTIRNRGNFNPLILIGLFCFSLFPAQLSIANGAKIYIGKEAVLFSENTAASKEHFSYFFSSPSFSESGIYIAKGTMVYTSQYTAEKTVAKMTKTAKTALVSKKIQKQLLAKNTVKHITKTAAPEKPKKTYLPAENSSSYTVLSSIAKSGVTIQEQLPKKKNFRDTPFPKKAYKLQYAGLAFHKSAIYKTADAVHLLYFFNDCKMRPPPAIKA